VAAVLSTSGFVFDPENIAVITGQSEAYYGWVAANFLSNTFSTPYKEGGADVGVGALDLGGARKKSG